ncbi:MAG: hypothetical protein IKT40_12555 [Bacilli bacterium]|nr:hypothetical protein [Bacilli bacterium]
MERINDRMVQKALRESIDKVLVKENNQSHEQPLQDALRILRELTHSDYIPFNSPSPSSTEMVIKKNVMQAIDLISRAIIADRQLYNR